MNPKRKKEAGGRWLDGKDGNPCVPCSKIGLERFCGGSKRVNMTDREFWIEVNHTIGPSIRRCPAEAVGNLTWCSLTSFLTSKSRLTILRNLFRPATSSANRLFDRTSLAGRIQNVKKRARSVQQPRNKPCWVDRKGNLALITGLLSCRRGGKVTNANANQNQSRKFLVSTQFCCRTLNRLLKIWWTRLLAIGLIFFSGVGLG